MKTALSIENFHSWTTAVRCVAEHNLSFFCRLTLLLTFLYGQRDIQSPRLCADQLWIGCRNGDGSSGASVAGATVTLKNSGQPARPRHSRPAAAAIMFLPTSPRAPTV